jgi:diguanylate cyclase (GGDEF)-like protein
MAMLCEATPTERLTPESLRSVEALLHTAVMVTLYGSDGRALYRNPAARATVVTTDERFEERIGDSVGCERMSLALASTGAATFTLRADTPTGERWHEMYARRCHDAVTGQEAVLVSEVDISNLKRTEERANHLALHDALTGLPNRAHVIQCFDEAVNHVGQSGREAALLFIDPDHFKDVNDTLGHAAGAELLVNVATRLKAITRSTDLVARLGGDEFLILLASSDIRGEVTHMRDRLLKTVAQPMHIGGVEVKVTPSVGVALYPHDGTDFDTLLRNADLAMYSAKQHGRNALEYFETGMADAVRTRIDLEGELRRAIDRNEFCVHYQPRVDVASRRIIGAEALVRWNHPERGLVAPDVFIPTCENTGLIRELGLHMLAQAIRQQRLWLAQGYDLTVSVNQSGRQLAHPEFVVDLSKVLHDEGGNATRIELEITESMLVGRDQRVLDLFENLRAMGWLLALDDFGTGYSNLAYLQRFPISTLKIDRSFVQGIDRNRPLAEPIVSIARLMNLDVVAEGVETPDQLRWVEEQGIAQYQGWLFARAMPAPELSRLLGACGRIAT